MYIIKLKKLIKSVLPMSLFYKWKYYDYKNLTRQESFSKIYKTKLWGNNLAKQEFYSGFGSHDFNTVQTYVKAINKFLNYKKFIVIDLGCGDFNVGQQIFKNCKSYIGIDIVPSLIKSNKKKFLHKNLKFMELDFVDCVPPKADVAIIREVLQHLPNADIAKVVRMLEKNYKFLILTESLPNIDFKPNRDKPNKAGPGSRIGVSSGVILEEKPFELVYKSKVELCRINYSYHDLVTNLYELN